MRYNILGFSLLFVGILGFLYLFIWWGTIQPILTIGELLGKEVIDTSAIAWEVVKWILKYSIAVLWLYISVSLALLIGDK